MKNTIDTPLELLELVKIYYPSLYNIEQEYAISLLKYSENYTFLIELENEKRILRVNRPNYHTLEELNSEVVWMDMLSAETDLILPEIIVGKNNELIKSFQSENSGITYYCSLFSFMSGTIVKNINKAELLKKMAGIGEITSKLHSYVINNNVNLKRFEWNYETLFGDGARWGDWREFKGLTLDNFSTIKKCLFISKNRLESFGKGTRKYGLIHSDLHLSNIITDGNILKVIDFDDCGYSWYLYDLGCSLVEYSDGLEELIQAWIVGYEKIKTLTIEEKAELPTFILMRRIVRLAWLSSHSDSDTAKSVDDNYLAKTIELCQKYLSSNK